MLSITSDDPVAGNLDPHLLGFPRQHQHRADRFLATADPQVEQAPVALDPSRQHRLRRA
jgi:hypothetical protein